MKFAHLACLATYSSSDTPRVSFTFTRKEKRRSVTAHQQVQKGHPRGGLCRDTMLEISNFYPHSSAVIDGRLMEFASSLLFRNKRSLSAALQLQLVHRL
jgi:hypothetical protein